MLICRLFLSSGSLPSTLSIIPLMFILQPKDISVHSWFCTAGDPHSPGWLWPCSLRGQLGMEVSAAIAKCQSCGLTTSSSTMGSPTSVRKDLQERWEVGLVGFSWQVVDHSEDSMKIQQPVHMSSLKTSVNQCYFIAPAAFRLALVPASFLSFKTWVAL